MDTADIN